MNLEIPELALVVLIGASGSGKSTFARTHFKPTETISSDFCRRLVADDENDQMATNDAFDVLRYIAAKRLSQKRLTVIDATNVKPKDRKSLVELAREHHVLPVAIVLNLPERVCQARNQARADRNFGPHVIRNQTRDLRRSLRGLKLEGFRRIFVLDSEEMATAVSITRAPLWNNRQGEHGPFDIIGDLHGCTDELEQLLETLGYEWTDGSVEDFFTYRRVYQHPMGRKAVFVGDLVDRGPRNLDAYQLVHHMVQAGTAICIPGNHDAKLMRKLNGRNVQMKHGLEQTWAEIESLPEEIQEPFRRHMTDFIRSLVSHYVLDDGKLVVAHAGLTEELQGRASGKVREFALYGETTGETDEFGLPVRHNWALEYRGKAMVVYGHTPVPEAEWLNNSINIDTGCVFGGKLTALRYPERETLSVPAKREYAAPIRPLRPQTESLTSQQQHDDILDIEDVIGKRLIQTRLRHNIIIQEENNAAALEVMSRFAVNPKWLIYLPPTMSPTETSDDPSLLEHPVQAFDYFRRRGVTQLVCEEKHMGSRAVVIVCRDETAVQKRFGITDDGIGVIYTRTGRRFFNDLVVEQELLTYLQQTLSNVNFWQEFETDWVCLDCELMPWSEKAQALLQQQYAAVGSAGQAALSNVNALWEQATNRGIDVANLSQQYQYRSELIAQFTQSYRNYCWPVQSIADLKLAPFHILAAETAVYADKTHIWHMETIVRIVTAQLENTLMATRYQLVDLTDPTSEAATIAWWQELTGRGGEGMVVKPLNFINRGKKGLLQPAVKCRGSEYLRIIYGPEYTIPDNLNRLRKRNVSRKRSLAIREFALGIEALERFAQRQPLRHIHECVFGILALESEPVDPRL